MGGIHWRAFFFGALFGAVLWVAIIGSVLLVQR